ncbi:MAG: methyltransferase domain-containing protein [Burkholderiales bacterium]|nr:methyltransferase domain-containing protein [Burkholderiales bacterium]
MRSPRLSKLVSGIPAACLVAAACAFVPVHAQTAGASTFEPVVGQAGKDVIWVPTPPMLVERMLRMAQVTPQDTVIDLGSGDGRIAIAAARDFKARSYGLEFNPDMVALSRREAEKAGVGQRATFVQADIYKSDFSNANVLTMYLLPNINLDMRPIILKMKPGTRVVSHQFNMGDWSPDDTSDLSGRMAYMWIVPARVEGRWAMDPVAGTPAFTFAFKQEYQRISGSAGPGEITYGLREAALWGERIRFSFIDGQGRLREVAGTVSGNTISGEMRTAGTAPVLFSARRTGD